MRARDGALGLGGAAGAGGVPMERGRQDGGEEADQVWENLVQASASRDRGVTVPWCICM